MASIRVEVVYLAPGVTFRRQLELSPGSTVADAMAQPTIADGLPAGIREETSPSIHSRPAEWTHVLRDGDRVELCRPLQADPKDARRRRATGAGQGRR